MQIFATTISVSRDISYWAGAKHHKSSFKALLTMTRLQHCQHKRSLSACWPMMRNSQLKPRSHAVQSEPHNRRLQTDSHRQAKHAIFSCPSLPIAGNETHNPETRFKLMANPAISRAKMARKLMSRLRASKVCALNSPGAKVLAFRYA